MCNVDKLLNLTILGAGIAYAGSLMADEKISAQESEKYNWMQLYKVSDNSDQNTFREQVQIRIRTLSQQEQKLMRETGFNGRDRVTTVDHVGSGGQDQAHKKFGLDSAYGQGFESRQFQQNINNVFGSGLNAGRANGSNGRGR